jgi:two-component SAPR family response regulator
VNNQGVDHYEAALSLLKQLQVEYRNARRELQQVSSRFNIREILTSQRLVQAMRQFDNGNNNLFNISSRQAQPEQIYPQGDTPVNPTWNQSSPLLQIYCLGPFQVRINQKIIETWKSIKAKSLYIYLITQQGRPVSKDILMDVFWPGFSPSLANNSLKTAVRLLRQTFSSAYIKESDFTWIKYQSGHYMVNMDVNIWLDVMQFEQHWNTGKQLEKDHKLDEAIVEYEAAEALYHGDYLEENLYEDWTSLRREALKDIYLTILNKLAMYSMEKDNYYDCINNCQKILARDPCREDAYRLIMRCYSRLGQRNRAIAWYNLCKTVIMKELNVSPDQYTVVLYNSLFDNKSI